MKQTVSIFAEGKNMPDYFTNANTRKLAIVKNREVNEFFGEEWWRGEQLPGHS
jgi:hypothetical protein